MKESVFLFLMVAAVYASSVLRPKPETPKDPAPITVSGGAGGRTSSAAGFVTLGGVDGTSCVGSFVLMGGSAR